MIGDAWKFDDGAPVRGSSDVCVCACVRACVCACAWVCVFVLSHILITVKSEMILSQARLNSNSPFLFVPEAVAVALCRVKGVGEEVHSPSEKTMVCIQSRARMHQDVPRQPVNERCTHSGARTRVVL